MARRFARASTVIVTVAFCACKTVTTATSVAQTTTRAPIGFEVITIPGRICQPTGALVGQVWHLAEEQALFQRIASIFDWHRATRSQQALQTQSAVNGFVATAAHRRATRRKCHRAETSFWLQPDLFAPDAGDRLCDANVRESDIDPACSNEQKRSSPHRPRHRQPGATRRTHVRRCCARSL